MSSACEGHAMPDSFEDERATRLKYQTLVYDMLLALDVALGKSVRNNTALVCEEGVEAIRELARQRDAAVAHSLRSGKN